MEDTHFISAIDLKDAFWQILLDPSSREKTAFTVANHGLYHFRCMPFGLVNSAARMSRLMDKVISRDLKKKCSTYLDDILVISQTFQEHIQTLEELALCLRKAGLTINIQKSKFCVKSVKYLGYVVGQGQLKKDPDKVSAVENFPVLISVKAVRRFLGMVGWYSRFIENFSGCAAPISDVIKKHKKFNWTPEAQTAFENLKNALTSAPILWSPNYSLPFHIQCDASTVGIGSVIFQLDTNQQERVVAYHSKKLNGAQKNYTITELECLAVVESIKKFRHFIEGTTFTVITDHWALKWLMSAKNLNGRLVRWALSLQPYSFSIEHRRGSKNVVPDALSRAYYS